MREETGRGAIVERGVQPSFPQRWHMASGRRVLARAGIQRLGVSLEISRPWQMFDAQHNLVTRRDGGGP